MAVESVGALARQAFDAFERQHEPKRHTDFEQVSVSSLSPSAALASWVETWRHLARWRYCAGKCFSTRSRTSARVLSFITVGIVRGRGKRRDQSGRGKATFLTQEDQTVLR